MIVIFKEPFNIEYSYFILTTNTCQKLVFVIRIHCIQFFFNTILLKRKETKIFALYSDLIIGVPPYYGFVFFELTKYFAGVRYWIQIAIFNITFCE